MSSRAIKRLRFFDLMRGGLSGSVIVRLSLLMLGTALRLDPSRGGR